MHRRLLVPALLSSVVALSGCQHGLTHPGAGAAKTEVQPSASVAAADDNLNAVLWMQSSVEFRATAAQTYRAAADQLDAALADPQWDALVPDERANPPTGLKPAVIVDIDETVLDNSPYQARLIQTGLQYDPATWAAWVAEASARPVPGVVEFAQAASARGITMIYISNRNHDQQAATLANLRAVGLPVADNSVYLGKGLQVEHCAQPSSSDKQCRRQLVGRSYRVLMQFGDQLGDFVQVEPNTTAHRQALLEQYGDRFGERWWMLSNPTYGDWLPALFGNDWSLPPAAQREAKRAALDTAGAVVDPGRD
ncbi:5'-nucleotidase, lipoprotein e(P4) family [Lysobacter sp. A421]